jgi:hypothetical protein
VRRGPKEMDEGRRWSSLREGSSGGLDSWWGGNGAGGHSGQEAMGQEGSSVALEEGREHGRE